MRISDWSPDVCSSDLVWLDGAYGARVPDPGQPVAVHARPAGLEAHWRGAATGAAGSVVVTDADRRPVVEAEIAEPVPTIHKWRWWNALIGNPAGDLPQEAPVERLEIELPRLEVLGIGPSWLRERKRAVSGKSWSVLGIPGGSRY